MVPGTAAFLLALLLAAVLGPRAPLDARSLPEARTEPHTIRIAHIEQAPPPPPTPVREPDPPAPDLPSVPELPDPPTPAGNRLQSNESLQSGRLWLATGSFPELRATYRRIGFAAYRDAMSALGARFFLYDVSRRRLVAEVDPETGARLPDASRSDLSPWPRDVTRHLSDVVARATDSGASRIVLLPPAELDAALLGSVDAHLRTLTLDPASVRRLDLAYELRDGRLGCEVITAAFDDGSERALDLRVDLSPRMSGEEA